MTTGMVLDPTLARPDDHRTAAEAAAAAGRLLLDLRSGRDGGSAPGMGSGLGADGDRLANRVILGLLGAGCPGDPVL